MTLASAEDAWFWAAEGARKRAEGRRSADTAGPAATVDDVVLAVQRLVAGRRLGRAHLRVLELCGRRGWPPHPQSEPVCARLWAEAMDRLEPELRRRGLIERRAA